MIKLTAAAGHDIYLNPAHIEACWTVGSVTRVAVGTQLFSVQESAPEVVKVAFSPRVEYIQPLATKAPAKTTKG